ncbi:UDP-glycosyltransferase 91C1 [Gossypium hirsutum]|uniref:UDP-glycosyltransferase 91C1 n=1 Tax=Gossypium hirsutum TaxID=3635 RepID=A0ABM3BNE7_GOSHI|nr:UDP-glycosyltransferase 91C1-like [Gossypium hirsutum]
MQLQQYKKEFKALTEKKLQRIVQDLPAEVESISELPIDQIPSLKKAYDNLPDPLTEFLKNSNVNWIIHDFAPYWLPRVATLLGINLIFFSTFNATSFVSMGPPSALLGDLQQRPEDFKAVPEDPCNIAIYEAPRDSELPTLHGRGVVASITAVPLNEDKRDDKCYGYSSIGCFLSHGGWSSIIEALKFGRALIVFSGASADQGLNARLLHGRKVGLEIERNETDGSFTSDLVAETIRQVMMEPKGEAIRANAWAMREIFDNEELSNNCLDGFTWIIEEFAPSACHSQV